MSILALPSRFKLALFFLFLSVPLAVFQVILVRLAPWWNLPFPLLSSWAMGVGIFCFVVAAGLSRGSFWAYPLTLVLNGIWFLSSLWFLFRIRVPALGFFTLFLAAYQLVKLTWLKAELGRSYFHADLAWFQGLPRAYPGVRCELSSDLLERKIPFFVSRLDDEGVFLFSEKKSYELMNELFPENPRRMRFENLFKKNKNCSLEFSFRELRMTCRGSVRVALRRATGLGIQFEDQKPDMKKERGDFIENLRVRGVLGD